MLNLDQPDGAQRAQSLTNGADTALFASILEEVVSSLMSQSVAGEALSQQPITPQGALLQFFK
jgi:hypothetical protein